MFKIILMDREYNVVDSIPGYNSRAEAQVDAMASISAGTGVWHFKITN